MVASAFWALSRAYSPDPLFSRARAHQYGGRVWVPETNSKATRGLEYPDLWDSLGTELRKPSHFGMLEFNRRSILINHRQSSTAFVCFLSGENNIALGVHWPVLPSSIKIVRKYWSSSQTKTYSLCSAVTASFPGNVTKSEAIAQTLVFYTIRVKKKKKKQTTSDWVPQTRLLPPT